MRAALGVAARLLFLLIMAGGSALAGESELALSPAWLRALYYVPHSLGRSAGLVATPGFYLATTGRNDPQQELAATLAAFRAQVPTKADDHALCRFPRRRQLIAAAMPELVTSWPVVACTAYRDWREAFPVDGASLVFSSNYLNNPSSMYGHTFLRLQRGNGTSQHASDLLDYAVNFAANPDTANPLLYAAYGVSGRFFGGFSLMPYYLKVQEYANAESRDLWEYPLRLDGAGLDALMATLWEVGPHGIRYWYLDENCSFVLLAVIAAADPSITAVDEFPLVVAPKDTVAVLWRQGALGEPKRRFSAHSRLTLRRQALSAAEANLLVRQIGAAKLLPEVAALPPASRTRVLDALLEWIAYDEKLAGTRRSEKHQQLWEDTLASRAATPGSSPLVVAADPHQTRPDYGPSSQRVALGIDSVAGQGTDALFGFRFALHDLASPTIGYAKDQEITMGDFQLRAHRQSSGRYAVVPESLTLIRILSIPAFDRVTGAFAWTLTIGSERRLDSDGDAWLMHRLEGGAGIAGDFLGGRIYAIPVIIAGRLNPATAQPGLGAGLRSGWTMSPTPRLQCGLRADSDRSSDTPVQPWWRLSSFASVAVTTQQELRFEVFRQAAQPWGARAVWFRYL